MKEYLRKLPKEILRLIYIASDIAAKNNMSAYLVGGFVRDLILGVKNLDLDIVVEGDGLRFAEVFAHTLNPALAPPLRAGAGLACKSGVKARFIRHRRFQTATIFFKHRLKIDIATARSETYPEAASLPVVIAGTLREDLARRDFSINTLAISITRDNFGKLIDFFGGETDIHNKRIRILHPLSFIDDPTRILRAVRFAGRYSFKIEPQTLRLLKEAAKIRMLEKVEPQRLRDEIILILKENRPLRQIKELQKLVGFSFIDHGLVLSASAWQLLESIQNQIKWFTKSYAKRRQLDRWLIYFLGLIDSLSINSVKTICRKFAFRKGEEKRILSFKKISRKFILGLSKGEIKPSRIFSLLQPQSYEVIVLLKAKYKNINIQKHIKDFFKDYNGMRIYISGHDLHRLGIKPGPNYQQIFTQVLNAKLNGRVSSKEEELSLIRQLIKIR